MTYTVKNYRIGHPIKSYDITNGRIDGSKWGLTDLYPEVERNLRDLLISDGDFETGWSCRKECRDVAIRRIAGVCSVNVCDHLDDLWESTDLIEDALYDLDKEEVELSDEDVEYIRDVAQECGICDWANAESSIRNPSYEDLMAEIEKLTDLATEATDNNYDLLKGIVLDCANTKTK